MRLILLLPILCITFLQAQNPIVPAGVYLADPSAHCWKDGNMYIYGSRDESPNYYCSHSYDILSSSDLLQWTWHKNTFSSKGINDEVKYSDDILYAPDAAYKDGKYYLYYCLASNKNTEGVATSDSPIGPFVNGKIIKTKGINEIDPCVFIDTDGKAYYIWGQFSAKIARLKPNMLEIDSSSIKDNMVTQQEHFFHEGAYMVKRKGIYYMVYAHMGRAGRPTCLGYATSKSPFGPFKYGGVIVDNDHCDPGVWNNHGSISDFKGKWYVFYHRSTHGSNSMRKICVEPICFNKNGSINEVEMTSQGAGASLNAFETIEAERACLLYGNPRIEAFGKNNEVVSNWKNNSAAAYKYINFKQGVDSFNITVACGNNGVTLNLSINDSWGPSIGTLNIPGEGDGTTLKTYTCEIKNTKGVHALWITCWGSPGELFKIDSFKFD